MSDAAGPMALRKYPTSATSTRTRTPAHQIGAVRRPARRHGHRRRRGCGGRDRGCGAHPRLGERRREVRGRQRRPRPLAAWIKRHAHSLGPRLAGKRGACIRPVVWRDALRPRDPPGSADPRLVVVEDDEVVLVEHLFDGAPRATSRSSSRAATRRSTRVKRRGRGRRVAASARRSCRSHPRCSPRRSSSRSGSTTPRTRASWG